MHVGKMNFIGAILKIVKKKSLPTRWSLKACLGALRLNKGALR